MEAYRLTLEAAEEFYKRCAERRAITEPERVAILDELMHELRAIKLNEKDIENQIRGKNVLHIKSEEK